MVQARVTIEEPTLTSEIEEIPIKVVASKGEKGDAGEDGFSPTVETSKSGRTTTITITDVNGEHTATILDGADGQGSGDMSKATYDKNNSGVVDDAEKVNNHTVDDDVPSGFFTGAATATYEGTNLTLTDAIALKSVELKGNTDQDGTPTPSAPVDIDVVTGEQTVNVHGKNLWGFSTGTFTNNSGANMSETHTDNTLTLTALNTTGAQFVTWYAPEMDTTKTYTISGKAKKVVKGTDGQPYIRLMYSYSEDGATWSASSSAYSNTNPTQNQEYSFNYTLPSGHKYFRFRIYNNTNTPVTIGEQTTYYDLQLEEGSATTYQPYQSQSYTVDLGSTELCKIGNYQDYIYKSGDDWYVHKDVGKIVLDGSSDEGWAVGTGGGVRRFQTYNTIIDSFFDTARHEIVSDHFFMLASGNQTGGGFIYANRIYLYYGTSDTTASDFETWLSSNNTTIYYEKANPTDTQITDATLIGQLDALAAATIYTDGSMASSGTLPAIISAETLIQTRSGMLEAISNAGTTYTAGTGISITNGVISCTFADGDTEEY